MHGDSSNRSEGYSRTDTGSDSYDSGDSNTETKTRSRGGSLSLAWSRAKNRSFSRGWDRSEHAEASNSLTAGESESSGQSFEQSRSNNQSNVTDLPSTRHHPFWEEQPEFWKLEEQRWRAAELLMYQGVGQCFIRTESGLFSGRLPQPKKFYILPKTLLRLTREFYERHCLPTAEADQLIAARQGRLMSGALAQAAAPEAKPKARNRRTPDYPLWPRTPSAAAGTASSKKPVDNGSRRGPKADTENHQKVLAIIRRFGKDWNNNDNLSEVCQELDRQAVPVPKKWTLNRKLRSLSWARALQNYPVLVKKAIRYYKGAAEEKE